MGRRKVSEADWSRAERLGRALQALRKGHSTTQAHLASESGVSVDTIRKLERGGIAYPALFIVSAVVDELEGSLDELVDAVEEAP
ncbi:MAG: helix-turn-helix transcriptional regulator [Acidimicrobiia bacterium]|nr:helix-turn-helix transcriptional regulator [Acidimicrobiia bacterium]